MIQKNCLFRYNILNLKNEKQQAFLVNIDNLLHNPNNNYLIANVNFINTLF